MDRYNLILISVFFIVMYLFFLRPQNQKRKEQESFMKKLGKGDIVVTVGGLKGSIFYIDDEKVIIESTVDHSRLEFLKEYISIEETMKNNKNKCEEKK